MLSIDILPVPTAEAAKDIQSLILGVETDIARWQQRQNARSNFTATIPYDLEQQRAETKEFLDDLTTRDQRMIFVNVTLVHIADTLEQLKADTASLLSIGQEKYSGFSVLRYQQEDGLNTALPYGLRRIKSMRTLTTESTAVFTPVPCPGLTGAGRHLLRRQRRHPQPHSLQSEKSPQRRRVYCRTVRRGKIHAGKE